MHIIIPGFARIRKKTGFERFLVLKETILSKLHYPTTLTPFAERSHSIITLLHRHQEQDVTLHI